MAGCKVRSGKPGRFEHKKGDERGGIRRRAGVNREQTGTWDAKKGHLPSACDPADAGNGKRKSRGGRQAEGSERDAVYRNGSGSAPVRARGRERNAVSALGEKTERGCSDEGGEKEGGFGKIQERNRNFAGLRG